MSQYRLPGEWHRISIVPHPLPVERVRRRRLYLCLVAAAVWFAALGPSIGDTVTHTRGVNYGDYSISGISTLVGIWMIWYIAKIPPAQLGVDRGRTVMELRALARRIAVLDPTRALDLKIGRPDLGRTYNDGGLFDLNHLDAATIASIPGFPPHLAERVVAARATLGGFDADGDLEIQLELDPHLLDSCRERLAFVKESPT